MSSTTTGAAIEVFACGFSFTRSLTHPCSAEQIESGVWVVRDAPRKRGDYRGEEYIGYGTDPTILDAIATKRTRGRYSIWTHLSMDEDDVAMRAEFKSFDYRLVRTEALMVHELKNLSGAPDAPVSIQRVTTDAEAAALAKAARRRQILPSHLHMNPAPQRQYAALDGDTPIGWVGSIVVGDYCWCSSMYVAPEFRRRGIARALLTRMLQDDRDAGAHTNVLLASHAGAKLYPVVGYQQIGTLYGFVPKPKADN